MCVCVWVRERGFFVFLCVVSKWRNRGAVMLRHSFSFSLSLCVVDSEEVQRKESSKMIEKKRRGPKEATQTQKNMCWCCSDVAIYCSGDLSLKFAWVPTLSQMFLLKFLWRNKQNVNHNVDSVAQIILILDYEFEIILEL